MKRVNYLAIGLLFWLVAAVASGGPITGPASFKEHDIAEFTVTPKGKLIRVVVPDGVTIKKYGNMWAVGGKPGKYTISGIDLQIDFDKKTFAEDDVSFPFEIVADAPPPPPVPPTPPTPPAPDPSVRTNPFSDDAARVLILFDPFPAVAPTVDQVNALYSDATRTAVKAFAGDNARTWPKGQASTDPVWANALQKLPTSYPWIMTGKGSKGFNGPLKTSADVTAAIAAANVATTRASGSHPDCHCGCVETGKCRCKNCNEHTADTAAVASIATPAPAVWPNTSTAGGMTFNYGWPAQPVHTVFQAQPALLPGCRIVNGQLVCPTSGR